jgi:hypothetical protein
MMFATVVAYPAPFSKRYCCIELNPADPMTDLEALDGFFARSQEYLSVQRRKLYFHPTSTVQLEAIKDKKLSLPVITSETHSLVSNTS